ncbi:MAG TPA: translation initiation factor IF-2 [Acidimicrobiales bacterium]|nr:translation initiation factor IF-2 [Acidimicrobiales bacterium]
MPSNVRVYELARDLGMSNQEVLDLCEKLGIGARSHSSSIVEAQGDRVRRRAHKDGLVKAAPPEEAKPVEEAKPKNPPVSTKKAPPKKKAEPKAEKAVPEPAPTTAPEPEAPAEVVEAPEPAPAPEVEAPAAEAPPADAPKRVVRSSGSSGPTRPVEPPPAPPTLPASERVRPAAPPASAPAAPAASAAPAAAGAPPASDTGKAIPPPARPPTSSTGKPIPPPPGTGGRGGAPPSRPGARTGGPPRARPGGAPRPGMGAGGGPRPSVPGAGPGGGNRPGGGPPGRGGPQRPQRRRRSRRRRVREELQPIDRPTYTPTDAAVPEGEVVIERTSAPMDIAPKLNRTAADVVRFLMQQGEMVTATQSLSDEMIELFAAEIGAEVRLVDPGEEQEVELQKLLEYDDWDDEEDEDPDAVERAPVVTVMGHVDHGKTLLLDKIRSSNVTEGEAGGITQAIGAYQVNRDGHEITFIDTPGHEAFTAMRARGADATDIVILVVAADDGVMPQTVEALNHAKAADVPIIVALNKVDRENADVQRVMGQLTEHELIPESYGGDTIVVETSALQDLGIDDLLEQLLVVAELEDLRANPEGRAAGVVLESHLDTGRGPVATVLVQKGTLAVGDPVVAGAAAGKVRALIDDHGQQIKAAGPSTPVEVLGLSDVAAAGTGFVVAPDEKVARTVSDKREHFARQASLGRDAGVATGAKLEDIFSQIQAGEAATLNLVIKADTNGSMEAVTDALRKLERDEVKLAFVHRGVGGITENDINLAAAANATILGFNVRPERKARQLAEQEGVEIRTYEVIYALLEDIESAMVGMLEPEFEEVVTGDAEVREIFRVPKIGAIAGCYVLNGTITRGSKVRFLREGTIIWKGTITSLRRFKDDVREVQAGFECGIGLSDFQNLQAGDIIETFEEREIPRA